MAFNRFDICEAWWLFASHYHGGQGSRLYQVFARLDCIGYCERPNLSVETLSENGRAIYDNLVGARAS